MTWRPYQVKPLRKSLWKFLSFIFKNNNVNKILILFIQLRQDILQKLILFVKQKIKIMQGQPGSGRPALNQPMYIQPTFNQPGSIPPSPVFHAQSLNRLYNNNNHGETFCRLCNVNTTQITRKTYGTVALIWCLCLFWTTGVLCCIPFCVDSCQDT